MHVVIVGNGVAGMEAALTLREREPKMDITIVSEESEHFFSRTALMWVLSGQLSHRCIEPHERDLYQRLGFRRVRARATGIDASGQRLLLSGGLPPLAYDRLLIACGSRPRPGPWPGMELPGVGSFVTLQDLAWLESELHGPLEQGIERPPREDAHLPYSEAGSPYIRRPAAWTTRGGPPKAPAVVGGGLIGIEAVEVMAAAGLPVRFFIREDSFWPIALDPQEASWIAERMGEHGIAVHLGENLVAAEGTKQVAKLRTDKNEVDCDLLVVAIGVVPNTGWLRSEEASVELDERGGIVVGDDLSTSLRSVFAAGDCASVRWWDGSRRPEQLWYTARDQGRVAARALLGDAASYRRGEWYNSAKLMDIEYTTAGLVNMQLPRERNWYFEERGAVRSTTRIVTQEERVVGFNLLGRRWDHNTLIRFIEERRSLPYVLEHLAEANFDTEFVPPISIPQSAAEAGWRA